MGKGDIRYNAYQPIRDATTESRTVGHMTSIAELAERVKIDNGILIDGQSDANKSLESIDKNFTKFFSIQERNRLDNLESKLDASRKRPARVGKGFAASAAAVANPFNILSALTPGNILKGLLTVAGILTVKPALRGLGIAAKTLQNLFDDAAKTQRGLNRFTAEDLRLREKAKAKVAKIEEARLKAEIKELEARRKSAIAYEKARANQALLAEESFKAQALADAEAARATRLEVEAKLDRAKIHKKEAEIAKKLALDNAKMLKDAKRMSKYNQEPILRNMAVSLEDVPVTRKGPGKLDIPVVPSQAFKVPTVPRKLFGATISNAAPSAAQTATIKLVSPSMAEDLARAGFEAVDTGTSGIRFRALGPNNTFASAEKVLAEVGKMKTANAAAASGKKVLKTSMKVGGGALLAVDAALQMANEVQRAKDEGRVLKQAELESAGAAAVITAPFAVLDFAVNTLAAAMEMTQAKVGGYDYVPGERMDIAGGMSADLKTDLNTLQGKLGLGQGPANENLVKGVVATESVAKKIFNNIIGAFTGNNKNSGGVLSGYENMTPADFQNMAIAPTVDASIQNYNNSSVIVANETPTSDNLNGGGFNIIGP